MAMKTHSTSDADIPGFIQLLNVCTVAGTSLGGSVAAGSVTVLGSHALGGVALSLGLVSAPLWPVIAGGAAGLAVGYGAWKLCRAFPTFM